MQSAVQLLIGDVTDVRIHVREQLDAVLAGIVYDEQGCGSHYNLLWITLSGRQQRREDIQPVFDVTQYTRSESDPYCIVLEYADCLTHAAANSMLKLLEEPPTGYYIIMLAESEDAVLETIRSRAHISRFVSEGRVQHHALYQLFTNVEDLNIRNVHLALEEEVPSEYATRALLQELLRFWLEQHRVALYRQIRHRVRLAQYMIDIIRNAIRDVPVSGNVKMFWRVFSCHVLMLSEDVV